MHRSRRPGLAAYAGLIALSAYGGAIGLATGSMNTGATIDHRLPLQSPVLGAVALALVVGVPNTVLAWFAWRGDARTPVAASAAGLLLIGWILVEIACIRELSWLQPLYVLIGTSLIAIGRRRGVRTRVSAGATRASST
jgi:hypothetical protein